MIIQHLHKPLAHRFMCALLAIIISSSCICLSANADDFPIYNRKTMNAVCRFTKNDETRVKPYEASALAKGYSKGETVTIVASVTNEYGTDHVWYETKEGTYVWSGDVELYYTIVASMDEYWWTTSSTTISYLYPDDSSTATGKYEKGRYLHIIQKVKNERGVLKDHYWYKIDGGYFVYMDDIKFRYKPVSCITGTYEAINYNGHAIELRSTPFTDGNREPLLHPGDKVTVLSAVINDGNNTWYKIKESQGKDVWVWSKCFQYVDPITLSGFSSGTTSGTPSGNLTLGKSFDLKGVISVSSEKIASVTATVTNTLTNKTVLGPVTVKPNSTSFNINTSDINNKLAFGNLAEGKYKFTLSVTLSNGYSKTITSSDFNVVKASGGDTTTPPPSSPATTTPPPSDISGLVEYQVVYGSGLKINKQYNKNGVAIKTMPKGTHFWADMSTAVKAGNYTWAYCKMSDGTEGWVAISEPSYCVPVTVTPTPAPPTTTPEVKTAQLTATASNMSADGTFTVTLGIKDNPGFGAMTISFLSDNDISIEKAESISIASGALVSTGSRISLINESDIVKDGTFLQLTFKTNQVKDTTITLQCDKVAKVDTTIISIAPISVKSIVNNRIPGDANDDGVADILDAMLVLRYDCGWDVKINKSNSDVNADGSVDILDAMQILRYDCGWNVVLK